MASNPFLSAINFPAPKSTQQDFDPQAFANSIRSNMHGADLSSMQPTWNTSPDFIKAMANSGPSSGSSLPGVTPSVAPSNPLASIWHGITNLYGRAKGGLENAAALQLNGQANNPMTRDWQGLQAVIQGFQHPDVASQNFAQGQQNLHNYIQNDQGALNKLVDWTTPMTPKAKQNWANFVVSGATDPLTYIPLPIGKAAELLGVTKALSKGAQVAKDSALGQKVANSSVAQQLGKNFVKYFGASPETKSALQNRENMMNFYKENIRQELQQMSQRHALTPDEMNILPHVWEGTQSTTNPKVLNAINELQDFLQNGRGNIAGQIGTNAELATKLNDQPILQRLRQNYFPHSYNEDEATVQKILEGTPTKSFSTTGPFNQQRQFNTLQEAIDAGLNPELNPYVAVGNRMMQSGKALTNARLINELLSKGVIHAGETPGMVRSNVLNSLKWLDTKPFSNVKGGLPDFETVPNELAHQYKNTYSPEELKALEESFGQRRAETQAELNNVSSLAKSLRDEAATKSGADLLKQIRDSGGVQVTPQSDVYRDFQGTVPKSVQAALRSTQKSDIPVDVKSFSLPNDLAKSSPRYKSNPVTFANDFDKAAYIVRNSKNLSNRDADFLSALMQHTGLAENQIRPLGERVSQALKNAAKNANPGDEIRLPQILQNINKSVRVPLKGRPLDVVADELGTNSRDLMDRLGQAQTGKLRVEDFMEPAKQQMGYDTKLADLNELKDHLNAIRTAQILHTMPEGDALASHVPLGEDNNFESLLNSFGEPDKTANHVTYHIDPNDETAFKQALQPYEPKGAFTNLFDKAVGAWKWGTLMNPAVHGHNIFYNGMYLGGASPKGFADAFKSIKSNPLDNEMYQRALKSGAVSADRLSGKNAFKKSIENAQKAPTSNPFQKALSGAKYASHDVLWDADKALRTTLFKQAVDSGMSDAEAANRVNKFMVNYNNTTPFENKYLTRAFPFYRWMKGNLPLQAEQWINNTPKQLRYEVLKNMTSNGLSGQDSKDGKINTGIHLPDGSNVMLDPYSPADEPLKMFRDGPLAFLYSKVSPLAKEPVAQTLNQAYYPGSTGTALAPDGKQDMTQSRITTPGAGALNNTAARIDHAASQLLPLSGVLGSILGVKDNLSSALGQPTKNKPGETPIEAISRILGGFTSRDNPTLDQYYEQKQQQDNLQQYLKWAKQQGITVPSVLTKSAYKKIPYPQTQ